MQARNTHLILLGCTLNLRNTFELIIQISMFGTINKLTNSFNEEKKFKIGKQDKFPTRILMSLLTNKIA